MSMIEQVKNSLNPHKNADKAWYLALLNEETQIKGEEEHLRAVLLMLRLSYIVHYQKRIKEARAEIEALKNSGDYAAKEYRETLELNAEIARLEKKLDSYKGFFAEPYFARMDVVDDKEGYNSYYIGKKGDVNLEIVDWRAPLAVRYYQKSCVNFQINEYVYRTVLRRSLEVKNGKLLGYRNEYLSVRDVLTPEEIGGRDEEILFDPYLRSILQERKEDVHIRDIIRTIQEQQFKVITRPERENFVLQGCAGSGKTMILLHRLSYLMYNNEKLSSGDVLVITPSDSFNAFIDELSQVLELEKVRTTTLQNYYFRTLKNEGIEFSEKLGTERESKEYLAFLYSEEYVARIRKDIGKIYGDICGLFTGRECREVAEQILADCARRQENYIKVKNSSVRVRRCVLGEMKEKKEGGFYFTKPFRALMSAFGQVEDFLKFVLREDLRAPDYFFRQFVDFYRCGREITVRAEQIFETVQEDLKRLLETVDKEINDLKRYRRKQGGEDVYTYRERIARRFELKEEAEKIAQVVGEMSGGLELFREFFSVLRYSGECAEAGKCENALDIARWLYKKTIKVYKQKYGLKGLFPSDGYAICLLLTEAGRKLTPRYGLVFVDEGQDVSAQEYALLKKIHSDAAFNVFGDLRQNVTPWRGVREWGGSFGSNYELRRNYRNTNEIVEYVSGLSGVEMSPVGLHGEPVQTINRRGVTAFFREKQGFKAIIAREEHLALFKKRGIAVLSETGRLSKTKVNLMTVFESKGLEFTTVAVYDKDMSVNEKYIACTRALQDLAIVED